MYGKDALYSDRQRWHQHGLSVRFQSVSMVRTDLGRFSASFPGLVVLSVDGKVNRGEGSGSYRESHGTFYHIINRGFPCDSCAIYSR